MFCEEKLRWNDARINCFKNEAELASLSHNKLEIVKEYLERVQVRLLGARTVAFGLFKPDLEWKWVNGDSFNGSVISSTGIRKSHLAWSNEKNDWNFKATEYEEWSDLYFCEKVHGETLFILLASLCVCSFQ